MGADRSEPAAPQVIARERTDLSPWVTLETISVARDSSTVDVFHAFGQPDYVHVLTLTGSGAIVLVRQYRPVIEQWTLELPGGLRDPGENPEATAARELREETGFEAFEMVPLIESHADVGRLCNKFFGFFALADRVADPEPGIGVLLVTGEELQAHAAAGRISHPGHMALLYLAAIDPRVQALCRRSGCPTVPWLNLPYVR